LYESFHVLVPVTAISQPRCGESPAASHKTDLNHPSDGRASPRRTDASIPMFEQAEYWIDRDRKVVMRQDSVRRSTAQEHRSNEELTML